MRQIHRIGITLARGALLLALSASCFSGVQASQRHEEGRDRWSAKDEATLATLRLSELPAVPDDPSNAWQKSAAAAELGKALFFDTRFSRNGAVACASCHDPATQFQDGRSVGEGVGTGKRRSMALIGAGYTTWLFWDGRKDSLWSQALGPLEDPVEHGGNRLDYARLIQAYYRQAYSELFGTLPDLAGLPGNASPNGNLAEQAAWQQMDAASRDAVSRVFVNMGKAIAAYELTLRPSLSRLDHYIDNVLSGNQHTGSILKPQEVRGLRVFIGKGQCVSCHNGPLFTDQQFHNTGVPPRDAENPDAGRMIGVAKVRADEFNCISRYSDARPEQCQELRFLADDAHNQGAFKTPGLRGIASRSPYMHAGQFASLAEVLRHYVESPTAAVGRSELNRSQRGSLRRDGEGRSPIRISAQEQADLLAFLQAL